MELDSTTDEPADAVHNTRLTGICDVQANIASNQMLVRYEICKGERTI